MHTVNQLIHDLQCLGLSGGDTVMVHSSYKSLGGIEDGAAGVFRAFDEVLSEDGTLMLPGFSYDTVTYENPVFDRQKTPVCVSYLPEYFRTQVPGVIRSMHATHSCLLKGKRAEEMIRGHELDLTPVGSNSPLRKLPGLDGKILFLGCSPDHNTLCHGVEETAEPPYLLDHERMIHYTLRDGETVIEQTALHHSFQKDGWFYEQRLFPDHFLPDCG